MNYLINNDNDEDNNLALQKIEEEILNNENYDENLKQFMNDIKIKFISLMEQNNQLRIYCSNLINSNEQIEILTNKNNELQTNNKKLKYNIQNLLNRFELLKKQKPKIIGSN